MANSNSMLKKFLDKEIAVNAIYIDVVSNDKGQEFALLAVIRSIGGDLFDYHVWSPEIKVFLEQSELKTGSIVQFEGTVSSYENRKGTLDYTLTDIHNLKIIGDSFSQVKCESCNYKRRVTDLKDDLDFQKEIVDRKEDRQESSKRISWLNDEMRNLEISYRASKRKTKSLAKEKNALLNTLEQIYDISRKKTVKNADRMKKRIRTLIEDSAIKILKERNMSIEPLLESKLTKKLFMQLTSGHYIVSNIYVASSQSAFEEVISPQGEREEQWKRIVLAYAGQRSCRVFESKKDYLKWLFQMHHDQPAKKDISIF